MSGIDLAMLVLGTAAAGPPTPPPSGNPPTISLSGSSNNVTGQSGTVNRAFVANYTSAAGNPRFSFSYSGNTSQLSGRTDNINAGIDYNIQDFQVGTRYALTLTLTITDANGSASATATSYVTRTS